ncbi:hypothetical protein KJ965_05000, partial [Patescibacteria group bacterium]|nr:hypothetical protein [Patescibacteria group bacterium]
FCERTSITPSKDPIIGNGRVCALSTNMRFQAITKAPWYQKSSFFPSQNAIQLSKSLRFR